MTVMGRTISNGAPTGAVALNPPPPSGSREIVSSSGGEPSSGLSCRNNVPSADCPPNRPFGRPARSLLFNDRNSSGNPVKTSECRLASLLPVSASVVTGRPANVSLGNDVSSFQPKSMALRDDKPSNKPSGRDVRSFSVSWTLRSAGRPPNTSAGREVSELPCRSRRVSDDMPFRCALLNSVKRFRPRRSVSSFGSPRNTSSGSAASSFSSSSSLVRDDSPEKSPTFSDPIDCSFRSISSIIARWVAVTSLQSETPGTNATMASRTCSVRSQTGVTDCAFATCDSMQRQNAAKLRGREPRNPVRRGERFNFRSSKTRACASPILQPSPRLKPLFSPKNHWTEIPLATEPGSRVRTRRRRSSIRRQNRPRTPRTILFRHRRRSCVVRYPIPRPVPARRRRTRGGRRIARRRGRNARNRVPRAASRWRACPWSPAGRCRSRAGSGRSSGVPRPARPPPARSTARCRPTRRAVDHPSPGAMSATPAIRSRPPAAGWRRSGRRSAPRHLPTNARPAPRIPASTPRRRRRFL